MSYWVQRSLALFDGPGYLDGLQTVYPLRVAVQNRLSDQTRRNLIRLHNERDTENLLAALARLDKFPYEDPMWFLMKNVRGQLASNPIHRNRIASALYAMTAEEMLVRLEAAPKLNTQMGRMFSDWLNNNFTALTKDEFLSSRQGIYILRASEPEAYRIVKNDLGQNDLPKRPDLVAVKNGQFVIGEAKWIGSPGGNQEKQTKEVEEFCSRQRGNVRRIGIVDGYPWAVNRVSGSIFSTKEVVRIQESNYSILSALLLKDYLDSI